jgi:hypothetical protein
MNEQKVVKKYCAIVRALVCNPTGNFAVLILVFPSKNPYASPIVLGDLQYLFPKDKG